MNPIDLLLNLLLGLAMGTVGGLFGIGGGLVAIPALGVLFGLDQQLAQGTALVMVVPNVVLALWRYHQRNRIELKHALLLSASGFACAWLASLYAVELQAERMRLAFVVFLVALALYNLARLFMRSAPISSELRRPWPWLGVLGGAAGALGGLPSTGVTLLTYAVHDHVDWSMGIPLALGGLLSISWGVKLAHVLPERVLRGLFCGFLVLCALLLALE